MESPVPYHAPPSLFERCWELNIGLSACQTSILPTEQHPQPTNLFYVVVKHFILFDKKGIISKQAVWLLS